VAGAIAEVNQVKYLGVLSIEKILSQ